jgi:type II secretion system protein C
MKQQLWIVDFSLLIFLFVVVVVSRFFAVYAPHFKHMKKVENSSIGQKTDNNKGSVHGWEYIFKNDIFDTFQPKPKVMPKKKSFVQPMPTPVAPSIAPPPDIPKQEFVEPLKVLLKGIIVGSDQSRNVVMIEDEVKKEGLYHLGEKIKDAQIIRITRDNVVFLRANGQQESFYLRKDDLDNALQSDDEWKYVVKKIDEKTYHVDSYNLVKKIRTLGEFLDHIGVIGTAYENGSPVGIRIGITETEEIGTFLGLLQGDIVVSVDGISLAEMNNRFKIFEKISLLKEGASVKVMIKRGVKSVENNYILVKIHSTKKSVFDKEGKAKEKKTEFTENRLQEREKMIRDFKKRHPKTQDQQEAIATIRNKLLENLKTRLNNVRSR